MVHSRWNAGPTYIYVHMYVSGAHGDHPEYANKNKSFRPFKSCICCACFFTCEHKTAVTSSGFANKGSSNNDNSNNNHKAKRTAVNNNRKTANSNALETQKKQRTTAPTRTNKNNNLHQQTSTISGLCTYCRRHYCSTTGLRTTPVNG